MLEASYLKLRLGKEIIGMCIIEASMPTPKMWTEAAKEK